MATTLIDGALLERFAGYVTGDPTVDRYEVFARCRAEAPIFWSDAVGAWVLTRHADVKMALSDEVHFRPLHDGPGASMYGPALLQWEGREHQKKGGIVARRLRSPRAVATFDAFVKATCERLADDLVSRDGVVDLKREYGMWIPLLVIGELLDVEGAERFRDWYSDIAGGGVSSLGNPHLREKAMVAIAGLRDFLEPIITARREQPGDDLLSDLCTATYDDEPLPVSQIVATTAFLLTAGVETTERAMSSLFAHLFAHPDDWRDLRDHPELVTSTVAESLRFYPPMGGLARQALQDVELHGTRVAAGDKLLVLLASANREEALFDEPDTFRLDRFADDADRQFTNASAILPFGAGRHHCTGAQVARVELVHGIAVMLERVAWGEFPNGEVPQHEGFLLRSPNAVPVILHQA